MPNVRFTRGHVGLLRPMASPRDPQIFPPTTSPRSFPSTLHIRGRWYDGWLNESEH